MKRNTRPLGHRECEGGVPTSQGDQTVARPLHHIHDMDHVLRVGWICFAFKAQYVYCVFWNYVTYFSGIALTNQDLVCWNI